LAKLINKFMQIFLNLEFSQQSVRCILLVYTLFSFYLFQKSKRMAFLMRKHFPTSLVTLEGRRQCLLKEFLLVGKAGGGGGGGKAKNCLPNGKNAAC
jgi:hypothetical protein